MLKKNHLCGWFVTIILPVFFKLFFFIFWAKEDEEAWADASAHLFCPSYVI